MGFPIGSALSCERPFGIFDSSLFFFASVGREGRGRHSTVGVSFPFPSPFFVCLFLFSFGMGTVHKIRSVGRQHSMERMDNRSMHDGVFGLVRHGTARSQGAMELGGRFFSFRHIGWQDRASVGGRRPWL